MKTKSLVSIIIVSLILVFNGCKKVDKPEITITELGYENSKIAYAGNDLHVEADVVAEGKIKTIEIMLHQETGSSWEFDSTYTEFSGLKNTTFHKHVAIPADTKLGTYCFHFIVTDMEGNETEKEDDITISQATDSTVVSE